MDIQLLSNIAFSAFYGQRSVTEPEPTLVPEILSLVVNVHMLTHCALFSPDLNYLKYIYFQIMDQYHNEKIVEQQIRKYGSNRDEGYFYLEKS